MQLSNPQLLQTGAWIDGEWTAADSGQTFTVSNPATGTRLAEVADAGSMETRRAIDAAEAALPEWRDTSVKQRARILRRWHDLIHENQDDLARLLTAEQGKVLSEARGEIAYGASYIEWFAEEAKRIDGDIIAPPTPDKRILVLRQAVGVVAAITPWNFPNAMLARKAAPALAAGCTVVAKPAALTPLSALALAELGRQAGIPPGVFNVICGRSASAIGRTLTQSPTVRKLSFTGSTSVGRQLIADCATDVKKVSMELGGNAPLIVFDDADLDAAIAGTIAAKFRNAGQTCICANRILVHDRVYDRFATGLAEAVSHFKIGDGAAPDTTMGPLISTAAVNKVRELVDDALSKGARALPCGEHGETRDCFYPPTLLLDTAPHMRVFREEIFGPVAPLLRFRTEQEAIDLANDSEFGLAAYFFTRDMGRIWRVGEALEAGIVGINEGLVSNEMAPFGGIKASGNGREGSRYGIEDYLEIKYLCLGGLNRND